MKTIAIFECDSESVNIVVRSISVQYRETEEFPYLVITSFVDAKRPAVEKFESKKYAMRFFVDLIKLYSE